jgi:predicted molibdopterin-dependent oxidoreductase YjgC
MVTVGAGASILDACDTAGRYVPRLCHYPGFSCRCGASAENGWDLWDECGLCVVRLGDGSEVLACATAAIPGLEVVTDDPALRAARLQRLAPILARHPHVCLTCPDSDGCSRDECTYGNPPEARCCAEFGRCELGKVVGFVDAAGSLPRWAVTAARAAVTEGRIRREIGLCVGCGRCVRVCETAPQAGRILEMTAADVEAGDGALESLRPRVVARPKEGTLRESGCTFCGLCVVVCPTGALIAPGEAGARWLAGRREKSAMVAPVLPPADRSLFTGQVVGAVLARAGVVRLLDREGEVLRISGVADARGALTEALTDPDCAEAAYFQVEYDDLYTQRESELLARYAQERGHLPPGNVVDDDLFTDDLC